MLIFHCKNHKMAFVSCCGYKSRNFRDKIDNDDSTIIKLSEENYDIMVHMGDQIYSDIIKTKSNYEAEYRKMYRKVFGSIAMKKRLLRKGGI